ncbi:MAG: endonuclease domain-containing protein [Gammaproteobacteria bacterium]
MSDMTRIHPVAKERARTLRTAMSDAERQLWGRLRKRQVGAYRFRRQHPLGRVDFVCLEARLVVEVDGEPHVERVGYDQKRSAWLGKHGSRVVRFWNHEAMNQTEAVMTVISEALHASVQPPSPGRGKEYEGISEPIHRSDWPERRAGDGVEPGRSMLRLRCATLSTDGSQRWRVIFKTLH